MYGLISMLATGMLVVCSVFLLAELIDMIANARRRSSKESFGAFNLRPRSSRLRERHDHTTRTRGGGWGGLNKVD